MLVPSLRADAYPALFRSAMFTDLQRVLDTPEFEDNGGVVLAAARWAHPACELVLDVRTADEARPREVWRVRCAEVRASRLASE